MKRRGSDGREKRERRKPDVFALDLPMLFQGEILPQHVIVLSILCRRADEMCHREMDEYKWTLKGESWGDEGEGKAWKEVVEDVALLLV